MYNVMTNNWIDPEKCGMESVLDKDKYHIVYLMRAHDDKFCLATEQEFVDVHNGSNTFYINNMCALSVRKDDVENFNEDGVLITSAIPRTKIAVDSLFLDSDSLVSALKNASAYYKII